MSLLLTLLRTENEENAVLCIKIILDLHRSYSRPQNPVAPTTTDTATPVEPPAKSAMELSVDEFLKIVSDLFKGMSAVVEEQFNSSSSGNTPGDSSIPSPVPALAAPPFSIEPDTNVSVMLSPAMKSFKLLQECPAAIVFIFQTYRPMVETAITIFVPLVFEVSLLFLYFEMKKSRKVNVCRIADFIIYTIQLVSQT